MDRWVSAEIAGFALQVLALRKGSLIVVQPVITTSLVFTLGLSATFSRQALRARDWAAAVAVVAGLSVFLVVSHPDEGGRADAGPAGWAVSGACVVAATVVSVMAGRHSIDRRRAALFAVAAGLGDATVAVLSKAFASPLEASVGATRALGVIVAVALMAAGLIVLSHSTMVVDRDNESPSALNPSEAS